MLCAKFGWNMPSGSGEEDFKILLMYFRYFFLISPWKGTGRFLWTNLNPLHPRMFCAKFGWFWRRMFFKLSQRFWRRRRKLEKFTTTRTTTPTTDKFTRYFDTGELKMFKGVEVVRKSSASASTDIVLYYWRFHRHKDCINRFPIDSVHTAQNENFMF